MTVNEPVLIGDPAVTSVEVNDCGEALCDAAEHGLLIDDRLADPDGFYRRLRRDVIRRLSRADELLPAGWRFAVVEGYRPIATQRRYFEEYLATLTIEHSTMPADQLYRLATRHIAPVLEAGHPPHSTGGAVDITMYDSAGCEVEVGCEVNATPEQSGGACYTAAPGLSPTHRHNRDVLTDALSQVGMINYAPEWWHWSYGDQLWALQTQAPSTRYSRTSEANALRSSN
jgi:D-alanyl-D-alanine dipeptidase